MPMSERLRSFLNGAKVRYTVAKHPVVYTAQEIAASQHVPGRQLAKSVLIKTERGPVLAVLPAIHLIDLKKLKALLRAQTIAIAKETDIRTQFPDIEVGAMSPFGNLYQVSVMVDRELGQSPEIVFNAGTHTETIKMRYQDFAKLVAPKTGAFGQPIRGQSARKKGARKGKPSKRLTKQSSSKRSAKKSATKPTRRR